jgi:acetyl-CoA carboxylase carboxyl transferase subunit alpha
MLENSIYSVISPEGCASIMWKDANKKQQAAAALKYTATDVQLMGCVDDVIAEPEGGSHNDPEAAFEVVRDRLRHHLASLRALSTEQLLDERYRKFRNIAQFYTSDSALPTAATSA